VRAARRRAASISRRAPRRRRLRRLRALRLSAWCCRLRSPCAVPAPGGGAKAARPLARGLPPSPSSTRV
jgi:hypothetical protein